MNAALLVMSSALASGGDVIPAGWGELPLPAVHAGACCTPAPGACCDSGRTKLLDKLKATFGATKGSDCCSPCAPAYYQPNLLDKMKDRWGTKHGCGCANACPAPACEPTPGPVAVPTPQEVPKDMKPKPETEPVRKGGNAAAAAPAVAPKPIPLPLPAAPLSDPKPSRTTSPY